MSCFVLLKTASARSAFVLLALSSVLGMKAQELPDAPQPQTQPLSAEHSSEGFPSASCNSSSIAKPRNAPAQQNCTNSSANFFQRFVSTGQYPPLSPKDKLHLAERNVVDPFNLLTIAGDSAISVAIDSHSDYGPGMKGMGKYAGVVLTNNIVGEFFGTFAIPSLVHQDPRYHRMPHAPISRRVGHAIVQVVWSQGDDGKGMFNYGDVLGLGITNAIASAYVPGRSVGLGVTAERWATGLGSAPIDNFITEFLPDVARHVRIRVVLFQRIMNNIAGTDAQ